MLSAWSVSGKTVREWVICAPSMSGKTLDGPVVGVHWFYDTPSYQSKHTPFHPRQGSVFRLRLHTHKDTHIYS